MSEILCHHIMRSGPSKHQACNRPVTYSMFCERHRHEVYNHFYNRSCGHLLKSGPRKGYPCGKLSIRRGYCSDHIHYGKEHKVWFEGAIAMHTRSILAHVEKCSKHKK